MDCPTFLQVLNSSLQQKQAKLKIKNGKYYHPKKEEEKMKEKLDSCAQFYGEVYHDEDNSSQQNVNSWKWSKNTMCHYVWKWIW